MTTARSLRLFGTGGGLWLLAVAITALTGNSILVPTVILLGTFLVPVTVVAWLFGQRAGTAFTASRLASAFVTGGVLGILGAALFEHWLLGAGTFTYLEVGLIEEAAKLAVLVAFARGLRHFQIRDGILLGAAIGFGYAAFESSGYALNAFTNGWSLTNLVGSELLRGATAPLGHGLWTAILGGVLFAGARATRRLRARLGVAGAFVLVVALHTLWDSIDGIAMLTAAWLLHDSGAQLATWALDVGDSAVVAAVGVAVAVGLWHGPRRQRL